MALKFKKGFWLALVLILAVGAGYVYINYVDKEEPVIGIEPEVSYTNAEKPFEIQVHDPGLGLKHVEVKVIQNGEVKKSVDEEIEPGINDLEASLELPDLDQGEFELQVRAVDRSIVNWGRGNESLASRKMVFDSIPPSVSLVSTTHNLNQGGAGLVIYSLSKEVEKTGVQLGEYFFPAYQKPDGNYYCLFSFAYDADPQGDTPRVMAQDKAGNRQVTGFNYHVNARDFRQAELNISDGFLRSQMPQFESKFPDENDPLEIFLRVNRELREQNRDRVQEISARTSPDFRVEGPLKRKPSAFMAGFADHRSYYYEGEKIDRQVHLGVDLASTAQAPVPAAERGEVVFTGDLGIYGQTVILDHGLGLQTLYAHLSSIDVSEGQDVARGEDIGRTGTTGLAVGDHLHFEVLVSGVPVNPSEWWDGTWLENNIFSKISD
ncbi:Peptidase M23 [Desulfonatronospira thiodismutans ASO3-1]|uniref:Peptidase M23 n=1 Tax=Desulfonatronospira thiodismutans ASO3-1 TaxID=555779 RepID=D6SQ79_9BACT|nr:MULTISPECIES: M23 family metallopeptidase [Desulfonatronospira]EFI34905.1 Peptidase M23 [Desulfonatronospira thiodismutans ASO3-1]RQD74381.1 MAG: M23 family peptidase [Desulfonatronospira sp. MSAO_Bac3]